MHKAVVVAAIAALLVTGAANSAWAQTSMSPGETVDEYTRLANAYDDGIADLLADNAVIVIGPCIQAFGPDGCVGKDQAKEVLDRTFGVHAQITVLEQTESDATVTQRREIASDVIRGAGVDRIIEDVTYEIRDGLILEQVAVPDQSDTQTAQFIAAQRMQPPNTGNAGLRSDSVVPASTNRMWLVGVALVLLGLATVVLRPRRMVGRV
jgi:hypothetical protein